MEVLAQVQSVFMEHAFTIGMGLLVVVLIAGVAWFWMARNGASKNEVLVNQARVEEASMMNAPPSAAGMPGVDQESAEQQHQQPSQEGAELDQ